MELLFWRHSTPSQKRKKKCTLYLRITINGSREEIGSTGIKIYSDTWSEVSQRIANTDPLANFKNEQLALMETKLWANYNELLRKGQGISAERVRRMYTTPEAITYLAAFNLFQKQYDARKDIAESSKKTLKNIKNLITRHLIEKKEQGYLLEEFSPAVMDEYKSWCKGQGYKESYIVRTSRGIKQITRFARVKKWIDVDPLADYKVGHEKIVKPEYVDSVQLAAWMKHKFSHPTAQKVADLFVLYSRTGFHYQDLMQIIKDPDPHIVTGIDGKKWIFKFRQKTEIEAKIPIDRFPEINVIVDKYGGWAKLPRYANTKMNEWLKLCTAEVNLQLVRAQHIYPLLSVKHGRSSFCDYCLNELGFGTKPLITMMGRVSEAELERYVRADERAVIKGFQHE